MSATLKVISVLLAYPSSAVQSEALELKAAVAADTAADGRAKELVGQLIDDIAATDLFEAQENYVLLFDRTRSLSLHLFEHVHGESRDRGQAMVDLMAMYEEHGLVVAEKELPDYLPLFLEFLSTRPEAMVQEMLGQTMHIITALKERLSKRDSLYANAFMALEILGAQKPDEKLVAEILSEPEDDPTDLAALDKIWDDEVVTFGGGSGENDCGPDRLQRQMRAATRRPASTPENSPNLEG